MPSSEEAFIDEIEVVHESLPAALPLSPRNFLRVYLWPLIVVPRIADRVQVFVVLLALLRISQCPVRKSQLLKELNILITPRDFRVIVSRLGPVCQLDLFHLCFSSNLKKLIQHLK